MNINLWEGFVYDVAIPLNPSCKENVFMVMVDELGVLFDCSHKFATRKSFKKLEIHVRNNLGR